ncbi:MAG: glutathione S-transferase family protein [Deltaproteobacteria bacterium]|nr:glutathione S-transferase family protein [Deltaproteobacteria bacterium]
MIDLYSWKTPNGRKISIMLEEVGLPYEVHPISLSEGQQFTPEYLALNPNNKIPTIVDRKGPDGKPFTLFESGAILMYLAEKTGQLLPEATRERYIVIQWLMFQMGGVGPTFGQAHHFIRRAPEVTYGVERFSKETRRHYGVLEKRLAAVEFLGGEYSIADIATYPWVARYEWHQVNLEEFPNVHRWFKRVASRPAVKRGMEIP